ncbi:reverse transcriptase domain-containing protein [Sphingobium abikonense]|uniref:reverse transcriptase domain-containing protein n=1 Tax=Sphingobium abikonense TaxID=86193 RepID=UPI0009FD2717|nr:reverse transcriptase domain-containing protein [Sphingobium abikonense]
MPRPERIRRCRKGEQERGPRDLEDRFSRFIRKHGNLNSAWQAVKSNSRASSSPFVQDEAAAFLSQEQRKIRSISTRLQRNSYKFSKARGVAIPKPGKANKIRPIVISNVEDRVVQRCVLDALMSDDAVREKAFQPNSYGGIPRRAGQDLAGVPAAIQALLCSIGNGATHVMIADIEGFFTKLKKSDAIAQVAKFTKDRLFLDLFEKAISVDLESSRMIWKYKSSFPVGDIGVAQGNCLSPFIGNLILSEFDQQMNEGDCRCIRYIDDVVILAPSGRAASARFRKAQQLLGALGMNFVDDKTSAHPVEVIQKFEYLGIEFSNGLMRPTKKSRQSIVQRAREAAAASLLQAKSSENIGDFDKNYSIPKTLNRIAGMAKGWAQHYIFCNDIQTVKDIDAKMHEIYLGYAQKAQDLADRQPPALAAAILGYSGAASVKFKPFEWPI